MTESLPAGAVARISPGTFEPSHFAEVDAANAKTSEYLIPAVSRLEGLLRFYAAVSPEGSMVHVSIWDSDEHAAQLSGLREMAVIARGEMEAVGVTFGRIVHYPVSWTI